MHFRPLLASLLCVALVAGACTSTTTPSASPSGLQGTLAPGQTAAPSGTATGPSIGPGESPTAGTATPGATDSPTPAPSNTPGVTPTPGQPKPLPAYISHGKRGGASKVIALTLDADMYPFMYATKDSYHEYDPRVVQLIEDNHLHATIFANGLYVKAYPDLIKELAKQPGIEIANHSWDHADWTACNDPAAPALTDKNTEVSKVAAIVKQVTGSSPDWFRFPGGCYGGASDLNLVKSYGEWPVGWDCYFGDPLGWSALQQIASVQNGCKSGSIVITHLDNTRYHPNIYEALKALIPWWKKNGWTVVNITELMGQSPPQP